MVQKHASRTGHKSLWLTLAAIAGGIATMLAVGLGLTIVPGADARPGSPTAAETESALAPVIWEAESDARASAAEPIQGATPAREPSERIVRGRVVCAEGPLDGAVVLLVSTEQRNGGTRERKRMYAGAEGEFEFTEVPADADCVVQASHPGFVPRVMRPERDGEHELLLLLEPDLRKRARIDGVVVLPDGSPVPGASVRFGPNGVRTNASGLFELEIVGHDDAALSLVAEHAERVAEIERFGERLRGDETAPPGVRSASGVRLVLGEPRLTIEGRVVDASGQPSKGWSVGLDSASRAGASARTDAAGRFSVRGLEPGAHVLRAWRDGAGEPIVSVPIEAGTRDVELSPPH